MANEDDKSNVSDEALLRQIASERSKAAFTEIYQRFAGRIRGMLMKAGASQGEADEAAQEAMLAVWRRADSFDPAKAGAATWIFTIARNRRIDMVRRGARAAPDPDDPLFRPDPEPSAEKIVAVADRDKALRDAVQDLTETQRDALRLAYFAGLTQAEVAERLDVPVGTVKSRLRLAVDRLRGALGDDFAKELLE